MDENEKPTMGEQIEEVLKNAGHDFHQFRMARNLSAISVAQKAEISETTINNIENGRKKIRLETVERVCLSTGYPLQHFLHPLLRWGDFDEPEMQQLAYDVHQLPIQFKHAFFLIVHAILEALNMIRESFHKR